jgi:quinol monooxygenase YgiN
MNEIRVIARALARAEKEEQLRNTLFGMLATTRAGRGADSMSFMSQTTKGLFYFYEEWESQDALDRHIAARHYEQLSQHVPDLLEGAFQVNVLNSLG